MMTYKIISYDVWGNEEDGYEVNNKFETMFTIELPVNADDITILKSLADSGFCNETILEVNTRIDGDENTIYIDAENKPFCELRLIEE